MIQVPKDFTCLAIETAASHGSVALCQGGAVATAGLDDGATSSRQIFGLIERLMQESGCRMEQLDCIAYGCGPGSFTGVRVAASATQGLAYAQNLPVCRVSTLAALALNARVAAPDAALVAAALDARMGEGYLGLYAVAADGRLTAVAADRLVDPAVTRLQQLAADACAAGPGWAVYPQMLEGFSGDVMAEVLPTAAAVLGLAANQYAAGQATSAMDALPNYVRNEVTQ